jgi:hypothetical protein
MFPRHLLHTTKRAVCMWQTRSARKTLAPAATDLLQHAVLLQLLHREQEVASNIRLQLRVHNTVMPYLCSLLLLGCFICSCLLSKPLQLALGLRPVLPPVMLLMLLLLLLLLI